MKFFLKMSEFLDWKEVSKERYIEVERIAGFFPKYGCGEVATGAFGWNGIQGRVEYEN